MADSTTRRLCAVILTAIPIEYKAVRSHLSQLHEVTHPHGNVYECGIFTTENQTWDIVIIEIGAGDVGSALAAERAISYFRPELVFFVGVAGGLKDVHLGDVVVARKVYYYESGKANKTFETRPEIGNSSFRLLERAQAESRKPDWLQRLGSLVPDPVPRVFIAPIAAGEKVISSKRSTTGKLITKSYGDALAVEMEGYGVLRVAEASPVLALIIRGISDLIDDKVEADVANTQELAAGHASAFAFEILAKLDLNPKSDNEKPFEDFTKSQRDFKDYKDKVEGKWKKPSDGNGDYTAQNNKFKDSDEQIINKLKVEQQIITFFPESESSADATHLPDTEDEFTEWYYGLGDYEQYYVLTTAILHGASVLEVVKHTDSLYRFIHDEVERRGNLLRTRSHQGDQWESQQIESARFSDPLLRTISGKDLRRITYTKTRPERGVECLYWQDADAHGLSTFGLHLLEFLCKEYISRGELGQFFLNALQQWSEESIEEVSRKALHSYGVVLWCHDAKALKRIAKKWAKENKPRQTAELLDGAYEIYRVKSDEKISNARTSSNVLPLLKNWVKHIHKVLGKDEDVFGIEKSKNQADAKETSKGESERQANVGEAGKGKDENRADEKEADIEEDENQADEDEFSIEDYDPKVAIRLGCAVAYTYALIGMRSPGIALEGLESLLNLPLSNSTRALDGIGKIFATGVSAYVILSWSGRVRDVLEHLAASTEQLSHARNLPRESKKRQEYRLQRAVYLDVTLEAFFLVAAASSTDVQKIQDIQFSLSEPLPSQPAIPDSAGRDVLLAFLLSRSEVRCQEYITTLLCAAIVERKSREAFGFLRYWAEIVLQMREAQVSDAEEMYIIFRQFIVYLGRTVEKWCHDFEQLKLLPPPAFETFKKRLKQWCTEGAFYSHPIGSLAQEVLQQLGD